MCVAVAVAAVFFGCKKDQDVAVAMSGVVNFITGKVQIVAADGQIKAADVGCYVKKGEKIVTVGNDSMTDVYLGENVVRLMGNTELKLADYAVMTSSNGEKVELSLAKGSVFTRVSTKLGKDDSFNVSTPTAIAGVRGTEFTMEQLANGQINVACLDGKVAVAAASDPNNAVIIEEAEEVYVEPGKDIVKKQMDEDRMNMLRTRGQIREMQQNIRQQYQDLES